MSETKEYAYIVPHPRGSKDKEDLPFLDVQILMRAAFQMGQLYPEALGLFWNKSEEKEVGYRYGGEEDLTSALRIKYDFEVFFADD